MAKTRKKLEIIAISPENLEELLIMDATEDIKYLKKFESFFLMV